MNIVQKIETMAKRLARAREIVRDGLIYPVYGDEEKRYICKSHTGQQDGDGYLKLYLVTATSCTCADFRHLREKNGGYCKHRLAREILLQGGDQDAADGVSHKSDGAARPTGQRGAQRPRKGDRRRAVRAGA